MGLAISRSIIESYGGYVWAAANSGKGAMFLFTLPTAAPGGAEWFAPSPCLAAGHPCRPHIKLDRQADLFAVLPNKLMDRGRPPLLSTLLSGHGS
jgi:hypothetical protein